MIIGHQKQWEFLKKKFEQNELSHAYLFSGAGEIGKKAFAKEFAGFVGCRFPDLMIVSPEDGKEIAILKIREVQKFLSYKSYNGGFKIVVVDGAEKMNQEAQSCFLKTLEEPKGSTILFLISSKPDMLLPTISSRCQTVKFFRPSASGGQPNSEKLAKEQIILSELLKVINSDFSEKFKYVKSIDFEKQKIGEILEVLQKYFRQLLLVKIGVGKSKEADSYPVSKLKKVINLIEALNFQTLFTNASPKLALEILLMEI